MTLLINLLEEYYSYITHALGQPYLNSTERSVELLYGVFAPRQLHRKTGGIQPAPVTDPQRTDTLSTQNPLLRRYALIVWLRALLARATASPSYSDPAGLTCGGSGLRYAQTVPFTIRR